MKADILSARWIASPKNLRPAATTFYKDFKLENQIKRAILKVSAFGVYTAYVNGKSVTDSVLNPGFTAYQHRIQYQEYDITALLNRENRLEINVGDGWAVGFGNTENFYGDRVAAIASLLIEYYDGTTEHIYTDGSWYVSKNQVTYSSIYNGETVDMTAARETLGAAVLTEVKSALVPQEGERITEHERISPIKLIYTPKGETVIDFGQNITGYVELKIKAPRGARILIHHAEVLDSNGNFYTENYRSAKNEIVYVCSGGDDLFKPSFSFQGFRYIKLTEFPYAEIDLSAFCAIEVHSELRRTGDFICGNDMINQLYHNIIWGQKDNYLDIPTDCPQRDERLGWTGDAQVFFKTAAINYDVKKFFEKWLSDVMLEQYENGAIPRFVPMCRGYIPKFSAGWGDAACIIPWEMYIAYADKELLEKHFPMMKRWVEYVRNFGEEEFLWLGAEHFGDWLAMDGDPDVYVGATPTDFIASAYYAYSVSILVNAGETLGKDMGEYKALYESVRAAFRRRYMKNGLPVLYENGSTDNIAVDETETAYVLVLHFGLCDENERSGIADALASLIRKKGTLMTTGFIGTPYILHALSDNGKTELAYELLLEERSPSWLYSVCHGATTMWEHWNSIKEDGSFWSSDMNSFNHYAYGAVYDWIFGVSLGIKPMASAPGYEKITIEPHPCKALGYAKASYSSKFGEIVSHWYYRGDEVFYEFDIPNGVTAYLTLPDNKIKTLTAGKYHFRDGE